MNPDKLKHKKTEIKSYLLIYFSGVKKLGNSALAEDYFKALREITDYKEINRLFMKAVNELGANGNNCMWFGNDKQIIERIAMSTNDAKNLWGKSTKTRVELLKDWRVYNDVFTELSMEHMIELIKY